MVRWRAVLYGIAAAFVLGLISGLGLPFTSATLPVIGAGLTGLIAGGVAGYFAGGGLGGGAVHGFLATAIGGIFVAIVLILLGTLVAGALGFSLGVGFLLLVASHGVPGAVGGAIGAAIGPKEGALAQPTV